MATRRDHLIDTALRLFYQQGYHATGIDRILAESGVAKMTLYKHFRSKDELILAALQLRDERFRNWLMAEMEAASPDPVERLLAMFDALEQLCREAGLTDPRTTAEQLALLKEGAIATAQVRNMPEAAQSAKQMARVLLAAAA